MMLRGPIRHTGSLPTACWLPLSSDCLRTHSPSFSRTTWGSIERRRRFGGLPKAFCRALPVKCSGRRSLGSSAAPNANAAMQISALEPFGVQVTGVESLATCSDADIAKMVEAMDEIGLGVLVVKGQDLTPQDLEVALAKFGPYFGGGPLPYTRWPGQSPGVPGCPHLATLGNYRAKKTNEFGVQCEVGDAIAEYKPAKEEISEWHTDGSFLDKPKIAIALYAPPSGALPPAGSGQTKFASCARGFDALPRAARAHVESLASVHSWACFMRFLEARDPGREKVTDADIAAKPNVAWPLVRTHPRTGRRSLYINPKNTLAVVECANWPVDPKKLAVQGQRPTSHDLKLKRGDELATDDTGLEDMTSYTLDSTQTAVLEAMSGDGDSVKFVHKLAKVVLDSGVYKHNWEFGDFLIWDNRVLLHAASPFDATKYERFLYRMEFPGEPVVKLSASTTP